MDASADDEVFFGQISKEELELRERKKSLCYRKTEVFSTTGDISALSEDFSDTEILDCDCTNKENCECQPNDMAGDQVTNNNSSYIIPSNFYSNEAQITEVSKLDDSPDIVSNTKACLANGNKNQLASLSRTKLGLDLSLPQVVPENEYLLFSDDVNLNTTNWSLQNEARPNQSSLNLHEGNLKPLLATRLSGLENLNQIAASKSGTGQSNEGDLNLREATDKDISGQSYVSMTPNNSTVEDNEKRCSSYSPGVHVLPNLYDNSLVSTMLNHNSSALKLKKCNATSYFNNAECAQEPSTSNVLCEEQDYGSSVEKGLVTPTPYNSAVRDEDFDLDSTTFLESDLEIITINATDETNSDMQDCDEIFEGKENVSNYPGDDTLPIQPKEQLSVPEMTDKQKDMLRQLWLSPQSDSFESDEAGSPLMNALDLSKAKDQIPMPKANVQSSLATLDLSVDERIPVMTYINHYNSPNAPTLEEKQMGFKLPQKSPFKAKKTPMKLISHRIGVLNIESEKNKCPASGKKPLTTPKLSSIPVRQMDCTNAEFKKPLSSHGISTYKSKAVLNSKQKLFTSPSVPKKWNVASPVAKYIHEDPAQPLVKILRPKERMELPTKIQKTGMPGPSVTPSLRTKVPVAHYKLKHGNIPMLESQDISTGRQRIRLFPSPYTPKLTKHEGPGKGVLDVTSLKFKQLNLTDSTNSSLDSSEPDLNKSIVRAVVTQRTKTLFKPLE